LKLNLEFIESELGKSTWFAGEEVTGAGTFLGESALTVDVMMSFPVQLGLTRGNTSGLQLPRMKAFVKRMEERPAYKRAIEKVGPLEILS
jgi:glutathione S-transferase